MEYAPYYRRVPIADLVEDDIIVTGNYTDATAFRYYDPVALDFNANGTMSTSGWTAIVVAIESSLNITNAIDIEYIAHYEGLAASGAGTLGVIVATKAAPHSPAILAAVSYVDQNIEPVRVLAECNEDSFSFWKDVQSTFTTGLRVANGVSKGVGTLFSALTNFF
jgi:hypothetical protein